MEDYSDFDYEFAPDNYVQIYADEINEVLEVICEHLGIVSANYVWISDESELWDFDDENRLAAKISEKFEMEVSKEDRIYEIAKRIYDAKNK